MKAITLPSGRRGWRAHLQENYVNFSEFNNHCSNYLFHERLGFSTPASAWKANPIVQGGIDPSDFKIVQLTSKQRARMRTKLVKAAEKFNLSSKHMLTDSKIKKLKKQLAAMQEIVTILGQ